ncbi:4-(cytidine 5'-diphospho)-2-C-methyl-D-erythritol kinase [Actinomadura sp. HBU206391]|uniref:4-(cytidine 5'-diphospho)-2-C-methyl-D-erythritol kinase n=1 Tax=Actinomadura sp. HBU206391 TaxID=2731692 RepID=UPI00290591CE|nr:4-(cytidine 5'-diphospho)-2-C-methyl-D-erythritol kinase [Actinomadura sp. HBU206391]
MTAVSVRVPAKVNLQLSVGPLRDDGYHDLVSVFHAVSLFDELTATPADDLFVRVEGTSAEEVPADDDNLAARAARLLAERIGVRPAVRLRIHKAIPVAGGMAGGSADAAAALVACDRLWGAGLTAAELAELGAAIGSDVPFALLGGTAIGVGRGERLTPVPVDGRFHWVFALADGGLSTPAVYAECDRLRERHGEKVRPPEASDRLIDALATGDVKELGSALTNDLQPAALALRPSLRRTLTVGRELGALGALVSGSGPTCAFLAESDAHALDLAAALSDAGVARSTVRAYGPVPGAIVV